MLKRIFTFIAIFSLTTTAMCWDPYEAPQTPEGEFSAYGQGYVQLQCPCCGEYRLFPSEEFFLNRRLKLTNKEQEDMIQAISTYDGDILSGSLCPFCGRNLPTCKDFE